jgi:hypothetical protein
MRTPYMLLMVLVLSAPSCVVVAEAQNVPSAGGTPPPAPDTAKPVIAADAELLLKQMAAYVGSADQFTFHADITFDHVLPSGQKLQFSATEDVALQRPSGLYVEWSGDLGDRQFWYDGKSVTLYDPSTPFYASKSAPAQLDDMLDRLLPQLSFIPPLSDFLYKDPYQRVQNKLQYGFDLGTNDVNGRSCRTFAFVEKDIDWQIWIQTGPQLVPCKLVITYKSHPSQPQFSAVFTDWDFAPRIAASVFTPTLPAGTQKVPFLMASSGKQEAGQ